MGKPTSDSQSITHDISLLSSDSFLGSIRRGIYYAVDSNAKIINISMGINGGGVVGSLYQSLVCLAVSYATQKKILVVAGAGNSNVSDKHYPAACFGALAVGGTSRVIEPRKYTESNFGPWVAIAAPAVGVLSTVPRNDSCSEEQLCDSSGYDKSTGTSMSAPIVSGALALLKSRNPTLSNKLLVKRLTKSAVKLSGSGLGA